MKKYFLIILSLALLTTNFVFSQANVIVQLKQPPPFKFHVEDLWKVNLTNPGQPTNVYLFAKVTKGIQKMLDATSAPFNLPTGVKMVKANEIGPIDVNKYTDEVDKAISSTGSLPSGVYTICIYAISTLTKQEVGSFCGDYEILNVTKSDLLSPENMESVLDVFPSFNWLPPSPIPQSKIVTYEIRIVEILERQTAFYSMSANPIWFSQKGISTTLFRYPVAARQFKIGSRYAWEILTYVNGYLLCESEVWEFKCENISQNIKNANNDFLIFF